MIRKLLDWLRSLFEPGDGEISEADREFLRRSLEIGTPEWLMMNPWFWY